MPFDRSKNDPAYDANKDPLKNAQPRIITREIPITTTQGAWSWGDVRRALDDMRMGMFDRPAQLCEAIMFDPRVQAGMGSRTGGLLGRPVVHEAANHPRVKGSRAAKEALDLWVDCWPRIERESSFSNLHAWGVMLFGLGQLLWDDSGKTMIPVLEPFNVRYTYYLPQLRKLIAITQEGLQVVEPGNGHWVLHSPHGDVRGWMRSAMPAIAQPWVQRNFAYRDIARFCERHGFPIWKVKVPAAADPKQIEALRAGLENAGQESTLELPQGVSEGLSYDVEYLEAMSTSFEVFPTSINLCDADIILAILYQNLMTEVKEGSFAAARMHGDVRQVAIEFDDRGMSATTYKCIARPFTAFNLGDPDLAPRTTRKIIPYEDNAVMAQTFSSFANGMLALRNAGVGLKKASKLARRMGLDLDEAGLFNLAPTQVEAAKVGAARKSGGARR